MSCCSDTVDQNKPFFLTCFTSLSCCFCHILSTYRVNEDTVFKIEKCECFQTLFSHLADEPTESESLNAIFFMKKKPLYLHILSYPHCVYICISSFSLYFFTCTPAGVVFLRLFYMYLHTSESRC